MNDEKDGNEIVWEERPESYGGRDAGERFKPFYDALKANPGKWAVYPGRAKNTQGIGSYSRRHPGFQFSGRTIPGEGIKVYVRYIGPNGEYKS